MPDWCANRLTVTGDVDSMTRFVEAMRAATTTGCNEAFTFSAILPPPWALSPAQLEHRRKSGENQEKMHIDLCRAYGATNLYDWKCLNWGVPHDAVNSVRYSSDDGTRIVYLFETQWFPPEYIIHLCAKMFPSLEFCLEYSIGGECYENGRIIGNAIFCPAPMYA